MSIDETRRQALSLHERYSVCRRNVGFAPSITCIVAYPVQKLPAESFLLQQIENLFAHFPILNSEVVGRLTRQPYFAPKIPKWTAGDIIESTDTTFSIEEVFVADLREMEKQSFDRPLWQVKRHVSGSEGYVTVSVQHELLDGIGLIRLVHALLGDDLTALPYEGFANPRMEDTLNITPGLLQLLPIVWRELILPKLPSWLSYYLRPAAAWPQTWHCHPKDVDWNMLLVQIDTSAIQQLRSTAKTHQASLHSAIVVALQVALWAEVSTGPFISQTPRSERNADLGHPYLTNNFVSAHTYSLIPKADGFFWTEATELATYLNSAAGLSQARGGIGMLRHIPDKQKPEGALTTGWEDFYLEKFANKEQNPFSGSVVVSNLGVTSLPAGADRLFWGQGAGPVDMPFSLDVIGTEAGTEIFFTWREGSVLHREEVERTRHRFVRILSDVCVKGNPKLQELV